MSRDEELAGIVATRLAADGIEKLLPLDIPLLAKDMVERVTAATIEAGYSIEPVRDPEVLRAEVLHSMEGLGYLAAVIAPLALAIGTGTTIYHSGAPSWAAVIIGSGLWGAGFALIGSMARAMKLFANPSPRQRQRAAARRARIRIEMANAGTAEHERLIAEMAATAARYRPT